jgi:hypothetical protein
VSTLTGLPTARPATVSDNALAFVPADALFVPPPERHEAAKRALRRFAPDSERITATAFDEIHVVHPYENLERIRCPLCSNEISLDWWHETIDERAIEEWEKPAPDGALVNLGVVTAIASLETSTPCCGARISLEDLQYEFPVGFGMFVLEALNPNIEGLAPEALAELERVVGTELRQIWTHL